MNRSDAPTYTQNLITQQISATLFRWCPIFSLFYYFFSNFFFKLGLWCPCWTGGAPDRPVVPLTGATARRVVLLADLWWP